MNHHLYQPFLKSCVLNYEERSFEDGPVLTTYTFDTAQADTEPAHFPYIPTGCIELLFMTSGKEAHLHIIGTTLQLKNIVLCPGARYFGVRLHPGCMIDLMPYDAKTLVEQECWISPEDVSGLPIFFHQLANSKDLEEMTQLFFHVFHASRPNHEENSLPQCMIEAILSSNGNLKIHELADTLHYSERHLSRIFLDFMGISPKSFSRVVRFQSAMNVILGSPDVSLCRCLLEFGYSDQAHFQREFKQFTGITPKHFAIYAQDVAL